MTWNTDLYDGLVQDIFTITGRPDLEGETAIALRSATTSIHSRAAFPRDLRSDIVKLPNASFLAQLDIQVLLPRFRGLSTIQPLDVNFNPITDQQIELVEAGDIYDPVYRTVRNNIAYVAGTSVNVRTAVAASGFLLEWYQLPATRREEYNSWIAQVYPDVLVAEAAARVFSTNGNEEKASKYERLVATALFPELIANYLTTQLR